MFAFTGTLALSPSPAPAFSPAVAPAIVPLPVSPAAVDAASGRDAFTARLASVDAPAGSPAAVVVARPAPAFSAADAGSAA